jgi:hypothetical protein
MIKTQSQNEEIRQIRDKVGRVHVANAGSVVRWKVRRKLFE